MIEKGIQLANSFHLAGIVPVAGQKLNFNFPWHDCLQPIAKDYLAIERAVWECACAGCETVWIICHDDMQPLIRHRLGDFVQDPLKHNLPRKRAPKQFERTIPIYYVPIHPKDRDKRDCLAWSVLYGALTSYWLSKTISKWVIPDKFYAAFPYGAYDPTLVIPYRSKISSKKTFHISYQNKTVKNNEYLGFTFDAEDFKASRRFIRKEGTGEFPHYDAAERIPVEERWSARFFELDKTFECVKMGDTMLELPWYYNIGSWEGLKTFLGSDNYLDKPEGDVLGYHEWNGIGEEIDKKE
jgi:hypothetical protein